jgi:hypothetical protein
MDIIVELQCMAGSCGMNYENNRYKSSEEVQLVTRDADANVPLRCHNQWAKHRGAAQEKLASAAEYFAQLTINGTPTFVGEFR